MSIVATNIHSFVFSPSFCDRVSLCNPLIVFFLSSSFAVAIMTRTKITPNPPPSARNLPSQAHDSTQVRGASSSQAERPASSQSALAQATPSNAGGAPVPLPDFKTLYPWANLTLLKETSSVNTAGAVLRLTKGDEAYQSFHKEHDEKMMVLPCPAALPVCADDKVSADGPFCFVYTTFFKNCLLYTSPSPRD